MKIKYLGFEGVIFTFDATETALALDTLEVIADLSDEDIANRLREIAENIRCQEPASGKH